MAATDITEDKKQNPLIENLPSPDSSTAGMQTTPAAAKGGKPGAAGSIMDGLENGANTVPGGIARSMAVAGQAQTDAPQSITDISQPNGQAQVQRGFQAPAAAPAVAPDAQPVAGRSIMDGMLPNTKAAWNESGKAIGEAMNNGQYANAAGQSFNGAIKTAAALANDVIGNPVRAIIPAASNFASGLSGAAAAQSPSSGAKTISDVATPIGQQSYRPGSAQANILNETDTLPQSRAGDPAAPQPAQQKPGRDANGVITAESAKAAYGGDMQRSGGIFGTYDGKGVNDILARENKARGEMIDSMNKANGIGQGIAAPPGEFVHQGMAERNKWNDRVTNDIAVREMKNPNMTRTARTELGKVMDTMLAGQNQQALEKMRQQGIMAGLGVQMRGQDIAAANDAARQGIEGQKIAIDAPYRAAQAEGQEQSNKSAALMAGLNQRAMNGDAKAVETLRALNGKDKFTAHVVGGGQSELGQPLPQSLAVIGPDGSVTYHSPNAQSGKGQQAPSAALDYLKKNPSQASAFKAKYGYLPEGY